MAIRRLDQESARQQGLFQPVPAGPRWEAMPEDVRILVATLVSRLLHAYWARAAHEDSTIEPLDLPCAKAIGLLLAKSGTSDVIEAMVVLGAVGRRDAIVTSDPEDIERLLAAAGAKVPLILV